MTAMKIGSDKVLRVGWEKRNVAATNNCSHSNGFSAALTNQLDEQNKILKHKVKFTNHLLSLINSH